MISNFIHLGLWSCKTKSLMRIVWVNFTTLAVADGRGLQKAQNYIVNKREPDDGETADQVEQERVEEQERINNGESTFQS